MTYPSSIAGGRRYTKGLLGRRKKAREKKKKKKKKKKKNAQGHEQKPEGTGTQRPGPTRPPHPSAELGIGEEGGVPLFVFLCFFSGPFSVKPR